MKICEQLPYLYKDDSKGAIEFSRNWFPLISLGPDYKDFKSKPYRSENYCVCVLIGQLVIAPFYQKIKKAEEMEYAIDPESMNTKQWRYDVLNLFDRIREMIEIGKQSGELGNVIRYGGNEDLGYKSGQLRMTVKNNDQEYPFQYEVYYNSLQFMKWATDNLFPVPVELRFQEGKKSKLEWITQKDMRYSECKKNLTEQYVAKAIKYSDEIIKKRKQAPSSVDLCSYLEKELKRNNQKLGKTSTLPEKKYREILKKIPQDFKRNIGEKTIKLS